MDNVKLVATVLLAAVTLLTAPYPAKTATPAARLSTFSASVGRSHRLVTRSTAKKKKLLKPSARTFTVTATAYQAVPGQTDKEPFVTADNSRIKRHYSSKTRWMALSNDLLAHWGGKFNYGDKVLVRGISPKLDGVYTVHDTMNKRYRHCMDILTHPNEKVDIFTKGVKIQLVTEKTKLATHRSRKARAQSVASLHRPHTRRPVARAVRVRRGSSATGKRGHYFASAILKMR
jgi:3D (Asp-Asp-Asp) domain-containing protein